MAIGRKTGGRQLGSLNKRTREVAEICGTLGYNPVEAMIRIALDPAAPLDLRAKMHAELAPYLYAKPTKALSASFSAVPDIVILTTTEPSAAANVRRFTHLAFQRDSCIATAMA